MKSIAVALLELRRSVHADKNIKAPRALTRMHKDLTLGHWALVERILSSEQLASASEQDLETALARAVEDARYAFVCVADDHEDFCAFLIDQAIAEAGVPMIQAGAVRRNLPGWMSRDATALWEQDLKHSYNWLAVPIGNGEERAIYFKRYTEDRRFTY